MRSTGEEMKEHIKGCERCKGGRICAYLSRLLLSKKVVNDAELILTAIPSALAKDPTGLNTKKRLGRKLKCNG
jgi:hypothetical protein